MIRLFRRLRQRLLFNKKFSKYFLYAVGEILILIFGILIALQVNNWNEERKRGDLELVILRAIKSDLDNDLVNCQFDLKIHYGQVNSSNIILHHLLNDLPSNDSLNRHFLWICDYTITTYNTAAYETLKSLGVGLVSNDSLRNELIYMYDTHQYFLTEIRKQLPELISTAHKTLFPTRFMEGNNYDLNLGEQLEDLGGTEGEIPGMAPLDYEGLKRDTEYLYFLKTQRNNNELYIDCLEDFQTKLKDLISKVEDEISRLEI
jgi:hypothetical protein